MTALAASQEQARDARVQVARRIERMAQALTEEAAAVRLGGNWHPGIVTRELDAVADLAGLLDAYDENVRLLSKYLRRSA
jgi:hypothetical protein